MSKSCSVKASARQRFVQLQTLFVTPFPTMLKFTMTLVGSSGDCGEVKRKGKTYLLIRIEDGMNITATTDALFHEFAHCMNWRPHSADESVSHSGHWGIDMGRIWDWYEEAYL